MVSQEDCLVLSHFWFCFFLSSFPQENQQEDGRCQRPRRPLKTAVRLTVLAARKAPPVPAAAQPNAAGGMQVQGATWERAEVQKLLLVPFCFERLGLVLWQNGRGISFGGVSG